MSEAPRSFDTVDRRGGAELELRRYIHEQMKITPAVPRRRRIQIAILAGIAACVAIVAYCGGSHLLLGLVGGFIATMAVGSMLFDLFPTPAIRIARRAIAINVDVADLWAPGSDELADYRRTLRREAAARRRGPRLLALR